MRCLGVSARSETAADADFDPCGRSDRHLGRRADRQAAARDQRAAARACRWWTASSWMGRSASGCGSGCRSSWMTGSRVTWRRLHLAAERAAAQPDFRGMLHRLTEALGLIPGDEGDALAATVARRAEGHRRQGRTLRSVPARIAEAARRPPCGGCCGACSTAGVIPDLPPPDLVSLPLQPDWPAGFAEAMGWMKPVRCCCDWISPNGSPPNWPGRRGGLQPRYPRASPRASR